MLKETVKEKSNSLYNYVITKLWMESKTKNKMVNNYIKFYSLPEVDWINIYLIKNCFFFFCSRNKFHLNSIFEEISSAHIYI
jgi:hypothetical protein